MLFDFINQKLEWNKPILEGQAYLQGEVIWAVKNEFARTVEDFLARRTRVLFLDAELAIKMAPKVAQLMATALEKDQDWEQQQIENFTAIASGYLLKNYSK